MTKRNNTKRENVAPLWLEKQAKNGNFGGTETSFSQDEVQAKVFKVLQMCEDLFLVETPIEYERDENLLSLAKNILNSVGKKPKTGSFVSSSLVDLQGYPLEFQSQNNEEIQNIGEYKTKLKSQIEIALKSSQVWENLQPHLESELKLFTAHRPILASIKSTQKEIDTLEEAGQVLTFRAKQKQGRLTAEEKGILEQFKVRITKLGSNMQTTIDTNEDETLDGFMVFGNLRDYKAQAESTGFVKTPTVKQLISKTRNALIAGKKVFLLSPTGTGKTALAGEVLSTLKGGVQVVACHEGMTPRDFHGYQEMKNGNTFWSAGPYEKAKTEGEGLLVDEVSTAPNRVLLELKSNMFKDKDLAVIFTGNPKDEHTQDRERMDPALLREMSGIKMDYMPATETRDIILAGLSKSWGIPLSRKEVGLITKLCEAASEMQRLHMLNGDADAKKTLGYDENDLIRNKFLDPGTLFSLFLEWEKDQAEGKDFSVYLSEQLQSFIEDNGKLRMSEENALLQKILHKHGVLTSATGDIKTPHIEAEQEYILPSEMGFLLPERSVESGYGAGAKIPGTEHEKPKNKTAIESELEKITKKRLTLERLMESLDQLSGVSIKPHAESHQKALEERSKIFAQSEKVEKIMADTKILTEKGEKQKGALVQDPWPEKIVVDLGDDTGEQVKDFNIETLFQIMKKVHETDNTKKPMWINDDYVPATSKTKTWGHKVGIWMSECLTGSKNRHYDQDKHGLKSQLNHQKEELGTGFSKVNEDMYIAIVLHYIATGEELLTADYMRLNVLVTGGDPLAVYVNGASLNLGLSSLCALSKVGGVGGASGVSS